MELNIRYTQECFFRDHELYNDSPVKILVDHPEGIKDTCLYVLLTANEEVVVTDPKGEVIRRGHFSESISMGDYCISVEKNEEYMGRELREVRINLDSYETATKAFYKSLSHHTAGKEYECRANCVERSGSGAGCRVDTCFGGSL